MLGEDFRLSTAEDFAIEELDLLLPSGRKVRVKDADLISIVLEGNEDAPHFIVEAVVSRVAGTSSPKLQVTEENLPQLYQLINTIVQSCITSHKVVKGNADPKNNEVNISAIRSDEKLCIFNACTSLSENQVASFSERVQKANKESEKLLKPSKKTAK